MPSTSAQKAELIAVTQALRLGKESPPWYTWTVSVMLLVPVMPIVYSREKRELLITRKGDIIKLAPQLQRLFVFLTNCYPPLSGC